MHAGLPKLLHIDVNLKTSYFTLIRTKLSTGSPAVSKFPQRPRFAVKNIGTSSNKTLSGAIFHHLAANLRKSDIPTSRHLTTESQILLENPPKPLTIHKKFDEI